MARVALILLFVMIGSSHAMSVANVLRLVSLSRYSQTFILQGDISDSIIQDFVAVAANAAVIGHDELQNLEAQLDSAEDVRQLVVASLEAFEMVAEILVRLSTRVIVLLVGQPDIEDYATLLHKLRLDSNFFVADETFHVERLYKVSKDGGVLTLPCGNLKKVSRHFL